MSGEAACGDPMPCWLCGHYHTTAMCVGPTFTPNTYITNAAPRAPMNVPMIYENGTVRCGAGCASLPCSHWPNWIDLSSKLSQSDIERIARRVVELLAEELPKRLAPYLTKVSKED